MVQFFYVKYIKILSFFLVAADLPSPSGRKVQFSVYTCLMILALWGLLDSLWALLGAILSWLSQGTDFVLFSWLLPRMLAAFQKALFDSLIDGFPVVRVLVVVRGSGVSSRSCSTFVGLLHIYFPGAIVVV